MALACRAGDHRRRKLEKGLVTRRIGLAGKAARQRLGLGRRCGGRRDRQLVELIDKRRDTAFGKAQRPAWRAFSDPDERGAVIIIEFRCGAFENGGDRRHREAG